MSRLLCRRAALMALLSALAITPFAHAASPNIVISQVYGAGGNSGALRTHDYVELFNRGAVPVSIAGWSIQYTSAAGTGNFGSGASQITELPAATINPGQYYLVQEAGGTTGAPLPTADHADPTPIAMAAGAGKVALVSDAVSLGCNGGSTPCSGAQLSRIVDLVGYGSANFFEGSAAAPTISTTAAAFRDELGCTDTDDNAADFTAATPAPRNSASPTNPCGGPAVLSIGDATVNEGTSGTTNATFTVTLSAPAPAGGVSFSIATQDNSATTADNDYVAFNSTEGFIAPGDDQYQFNVVVNGDTNVESNETFFVNISSPTNGAVLGDAQGTGTITNDDFAPVVYEVVISQVYGGGGNAGATLTNDFVELFNRGTTTVNLSGWSVQYTGANGTGTWSTTTLTGSIAPGGYYLVQQAAGAGGTTGLPTPDTTGTIAMGAGSGKVALVPNATALTGNCPTGAVDFVGYGTATCSEGAGSTNTLSNTTAALRKRGGCLDSNNNSADFSVGQPTPRNSSTATRSCEYVPAAINQIQGSGLATPYFGQDVTTTGIVTARKANGFFLQTADAGADTDPATSEGIFVFTSNTATSAVVGDFVTVKGTATEFFNLTQLESTLAGDVTVSSSGNTLPAAIVLTTTHLNPAGSSSQLEGLEGMRVHADTLVSVAPTNEFNETDTVLPGVARPMREAGIDITLPVPPDPDTGLVDCCIPRWDRNPERIMVDGDGLAGATFLNVTSNVTLSNITGPLDFSFGNYKILPETLPSASALMSAVPVPAPLTGDFTLAGFNIENFTGNATQRRKSALAIRTVLRYPDVMGHVEIGSLAALEALATQVNDDAVAAGDPNPGYVARLIPFTGTQHVGFLIKSSRVQIDDLTQSDPGTFFNSDTGQTQVLHDRPPLILRATVDPGAPNRRPVIVVLVHMRSFIDAELVSGDGPRVRAKRTAQAESLAALLQQLQTDNPATPVMALGDYNAFEFNDGYTDPISIIKGAPTPGDQIVVGQSPDLVTPDFVNLTETLPAGERYSFVFEGTPQALDHVLVNGVTQGYVTRYAVGRNNADFPEVPSSLFAGDVTRPERASDHDMPIAYFRFPSITGLTVDKPVLTPADHRMVDVLVSYSTNDRCGTVTKSLSVTSNEPIQGLGDGDTAPDWEVIDGHHLRLRAERGGSGKGRVYTITVTATDSCGLVTQETITVTVPRDQRK